MVKTLQFSSPMVANKCLTPTTRHYREAHSYVQFAVATAGFIIVRIAVLYYCGICAANIFEEAKKVISFNSRKSFTRFLQFRISKRHHTLLEAEITLFTYGMINRAKNINFCQACFHRNEKLEHMSDNELTQ